MYMDTNTYFEQLESILFLIFIILAILYCIIKLIINAIRKKEEEKNINLDKFDEFDNINLINERHSKNGQNMEYESEVLDHVYREAYHEAIQDSINRRKLYSQSSSDGDAFDSITSYFHNNIIDKDSDKKHI